MNEREAYSNPHPVTCTCVSCADKRMRRLSKAGILSRIMSVFKRKRKR